MTQSVASTTTTLTLTENISRYAIYSSSVVIYYPNSTSTRTSTTVYRNQWLTSTGAMANTIFSTTASSTSNYSYTPGVTGYSLYGFATSAGTNTSTYSSLSALVSSTVTTSYVILSKSVTATFKYSSNALGTVTSATASATQYVRCTSSAAQISNSNITIPSSVTSSTGLNNSTYQGVSSTTNSSTSTTPTTGITTYYAFYKNTFSASFQAGTGVDTISSSLLTCDSNYTYNGTSYLGSNCQITLPIITIEIGYNNPKWYDSSNAVVGIAGEVVTITGNVTYTAKASIINMYNKISAVNDSRFYYVTSNTVHYYGPSIFYLKANSSGDYDLLRYCDGCDGISVWASGLGENSQVSAVYNSKRKVMYAFYTKPNAANTSYDLYSASQSNGSIVNTLIAQNVTNISAVYDEDSYNIYVYYIKQNTGGYDLYYYSNTTTPATSSIAVSGVSGDGQVSAIYDKDNNTTYAYYVKRNTSGGYDLYHYYYLFSSSSVIATNISERGNISAVFDDSTYHHGRYVYYLKSSSNGTGHSLYEYSSYGPGSTSVISNGVNASGVISAVFDFSSVQHGRYVYYSKLSDDGTSYDIEYYCSSCSCNVGCGPGSGIFTSGISKYSVISSIFNDAGVSTTGRYVYYMTLNSSGTGYNLYYFCSSCDCTTFSNTCGRYTGIIAEDVY